MLLIISIVVCACVAECFFVLIPMVDVTKVVLRDSFTIDGSLYGMWVVVWSEKRTRNDRTCEYVCM